MTERKSFRRLFMVITVALIACGFALTTFCASQDPVRIEGKEELFSTPGVQMREGTSGPVMIRGWEIDANGSDYGLVLKNINQSVVIRDVSIKNAAIAGLSLRNVSDLTIQSCSFSKNENGVEVIGGNHLEFIGNVVTSNKFGLSVVDGKRVTLHHNLIQSNQFGIYLESAKLSTVKYNQIENNSWNGIYVGSSSRFNTFHHNNFIENQVAPVRAAGRPNNWNAQNAGNYWSDYTGRDADGDGVGEAAYKIPSSHRKVYDYHPLIDPCPKTYQ